MDKLLKLDYDHSRPDINHLRFIADKFDLMIVKAVAHRTNKGYHVRLKVVNPEIVEPEIVLLQALMGSDLKRECLNYLRVLRNEKNWNVLFNRKEDGTGKELSKEKPARLLTRQLTKSLVIPYE